MALTTQDFNKGVDFSALGSATGIQHNQLIENGSPYQESAAVEGKGLVLYTTDSALDTPVVPNANTTAKWKLYPWVRIPHSTATNKTPTIYTWNQDAPSDATLLRWVSQKADITTLQTEVDTLQTDVDALEVSMTAVQTAAINAQNTATAAQTDATTALTNAATALANAILANTHAAEAESAAFVAQTTATAASTAAEAAQDELDGLLKITRYKTADADRQNVPAAGAVLEFAHGLAVVPDIVIATLVCTTTEFGYAVGDELDLNGVYIEAGGGERVAGFAVTKDATKVYVTRRDSGTITTINRTTGAEVVLTEASWKFRVVALKLATA